MEQVKLKSKIVDVPRRIVLRLNERLGRFEHVTWLIGDARSGTTWVSDLINHHHRYREMFEPIRPEYVEPTSFLRPNQYVRPEADFPELDELMAEMFSGRMTDPRIDTANVRPIYRDMLVKDCFANLLARWACLRFPEVRPVLLIRNPFSVAISKQKKVRRYWPIDPAALIAQDDLVRDHLDPYVDVLAQTAAEGDEIERTIAMWAVLNRVPLSQFGHDDLHVCFYEEILDDPRGELRKIYDFTDPPGRITPIRLSDDVVERPSRMAGEHSTLATQRSPADAWQDELSTRQIERGLALLDRLDMVDVYNDRTSPDHAAVERIRAAANPSPGGG